MRFVVFLFGIVSVVISASVGYFFYENSLGEIIAGFLPDQRDLASSLTASPLDFPPGDVGIFMIVSAGYALFGILLALGRCGWQGALLMIIPALTTAIMNPYTLAFTGLQIFVGLLAFFIFPLPIEDRSDAEKAKPKAKLNEAALEDEWSGRGKSKPKNKRRRDEDDDEDE